MIKLLIGGSPCTHWSIAKTKNRETTAEGVGWELFRNFLIALEKYKPDYFLYENNKSMSTAIREQITRELGVEPIMINSALVSAQSRRRLYWTNIPGVDQPEDRGILLRDILESGVHWREKAYTLRASAATKQGACNLVKHTQTGGKFGYQGVYEPIYSPSGKPLTEAEMDYMVRETKDGRNHFAFEYFHDAGQDKGATLTANTHKGVPYNVCAEPIRIGTIESDAKNEDFDSQQYRVYSPDGKEVTLCGQGGGVGAKTGLYATPIRVGDMPNAAGEISGSQSGRIHSIDGKGVPLQARPNGGGADGAATGLYAKTPTLTANGDWQHYNFVIESADGKTHPVYMVKDGQITIKGKQYPIRLADGFYIIRKLTVTECKRLQTVPDSYIFPVSDTQAYKMLGNGWTVDVIVHILGHVPGITEEEIEVFSMYDGMACGHIALDKLGGHITRYFATEIDKYAIQTTMHNFPDVIQMGDAFRVRDDGWHIPEAQTVTEPVAEMATQPEPEEPEMEIEAPAIKAD